MINITEILTVLSLELSGTNLHILIELSKGIFRLRGKITGLNISRYTNNGGSYRNIQRFFSKKYNWTKMRIQLLACFINTKKDFILFYFSLFLSINLTNFLFVFSCK